MTQTETLIASLTAVATETDALAVGTDGYVDWSTPLDDGGRRLEVGAGDEAVQLDLTREDLVALHRALTLTLLRA